MVTQTHSPFETLARVIEHLDDDGRSVRRTEAAGNGGDGSLHATVDVSVGRPTGADAGLEPAEAAVDGGLSVTFRAPAFPDPAAALPAEYPRASAVPTGVRLDGGSVVVTLAVTIGDADCPSAGDVAADDNTGDATAEDTLTDAGGSHTTAAVGERSANVDTGETELLTSFGGDDGRNEAVTRDVEGNTTGDKAESETGDVDEGAAFAAVRDASVPPYDDTPYLRRLYEACGTFAEMSELIGLDVSAETVRRYMIEADVHSPASYETAGGTPASADEGTAGAEAPSDDVGSGSTTDAGNTAGSAGTAGHGRSSDDGDEAAASLPDEQLVADGIGLPEALTLHDVVDAVVGARTVHEVQREVGLDYDRTRQLLTQLNVLDLVVGRVSGGSDRTVTVDVVADRIRECAPDTA